MDHTDIDVRKKNNFDKGSLLQSKTKASGEIFKEPFLDILLTDLEQSSFSLIVSNLDRKTQNRKDIGVIKQSPNKALFEHNKFQKSNHSEKIINCIADFEKTTLKKNRYLFALDKWIGREISFTSYLPFLYNSSAKIKNKFQAIERATKSNFFNLLQKKKPISCLLQIGDYVHSGDKLGYLSNNNTLQSNTFGHTVKPIIISESGKIVKISQTQVTIQKIQPVLFYSQAEIHVESNEWVKRGTPLLTLAHQTLVTGDIVQGIPRIEQLFEASTSAPSGAALQNVDFHFEDDFAISRRGGNKVPVARTEFMRKLDKASQNQRANQSFSSISALVTLSSDKNMTSVANLFESKENRYNSTARSMTEEKPLFLYQTLQSQVRETFRKKWNQLPLPVAVRQSLEEIQQIIVESIQKVYISQGVLIADKHIEIIVRQMTSKAQIFDGGSTGLLIDEILSLQQIENANISTPGQKAVYLPVIMGLTRAALSSDSFVSAASFQETTRVLSRDAVAGKTDFLRGLKEKVIIGDLIDAGTGLDVFYIYYLFSKTLFENKFRDILNRKITHRTLKKLVLAVAKSYPDNLM